MKSYNVSMRSDSNYPPMTNTEWYNAPFNEDDDEEIEVLCVVSYQKVLKVKPSDLDYDEITLLQDVKAQYDIPINKDGWQLEDIEVYEE